MKRLMPVRLLLLCVAICLVTAAGYADLDYHQSLISPYYRITRSTDAEIGDSWAVISHDGDVLAEGTASPYHDVPRLICIEGDILCLRDGSGTAFWFTFYDIARGRVSESYEYVIDLRGEDVLYSDRIDDEWRIVLANVFSGETIHSIPMDLYSADGWVWDTKWDEASEAWIITYLAGEEFEETTVLFPADENPALYPIRENGLWGYMNRAGEVVIEPHWDWAGDFSGPVAIVAENGDDRQPVYGIINTEGEFVVPAMYAQIEDYGDFLIIFEAGDNPDGDLVGWYDKASGYFQEPVYQEIDDTPTDSDLILVTLSIDGEQGDLVIHSAYCRRDTGEIAFLFDCVGEPYTLGTFHEGYAYWLIENADGFDEFLLNAEGARVAFPSGIRPVSDVCDGVLRIANDEDLVGLARPDGTIILPPTYDWIENPSEGRIFFEQGDRLGVMDLEGNEILPATFEWDPGWDVYGGGEEHFYHNGYALVVLCDDENVRSYVFLNRDGKVVFSAPVCPDKNTTISPLVYVMEGGRAWIRKTEKQADGTVKVSHSLVRLTEEGSEDLTGFVFDKTTNADSNIPDFHEGLLPVCLNGLWGYIWESGGWAYPLVPAYDRAEPFHNGLAMVEKNGKLGYVDYYGVVIWQEDPVQEIIPVFIGDEATSMQAVLHNGPIEDAYALIPLPQVLEAFGYPLSWESETLATFDWDGERYVLDTAAAALYPEGKDPERWNCLEPAPGNAGHTVWTVNAGADFLIDSSFCRVVLMDMGYIDWVEPEDMRVRIVPLRPNQMPAD